MTRKAPDAEDVRLAIYRDLASTGRAPSITDLAKRFATSKGTMRTMLHELAAGRHLVLDPHDRIVLAHPFAQIPLGFSVMSGTTLWFGGCAWDAFAIPALLPGEAPVVVATTCPACGAAHAWSVGSHEPPVGEQVAHFLVPMAHVWDDVLRACANQRIFCSQECVDQWLVRSGHERGAVLTLDQLWRLARHWYDGRLERGYQRRDPPSAAAYFEELGLSGPFWGG